LNRLFKTALLCFLLLFFLRILASVSYPAKRTVVVLVKSKNIAPYNMAEEAFKGRINGNADMIGYVLDDFHDKKLLYQKVRSSMPDLIFVVGASALKIFVT